MDAVIETPTADSSPALPTLDSLSPSALSKWKETGKHADVAAESSPASLETPATSTEVLTAPASEPGPPAKKGGEARKAELAAEIQTLLTQRAALRRDVETPPPARTDVVPAVSSPAPQALPDKPTWAQFEAQIGTNFPDWATAQDAFADARDVFRDAKTAQERSLSDQRQQAETGSQAWNQRVQAYQQTHPEFQDALTPEIRALTPLSVARVLNPQVERTPQHDIAEVAFTSVVGPQMLEYLSKHPDVFRTISAYPNPTQVYREMGRLEALISASQASPPGTPAPPPISSAPAPPVTLGSKPSDPGDPVEAALRAHDTRAYMRAMNEREIAQRQTRRR